MATFGRRFCVGLFFLPIVDKAEFRALMLGYYSDHLEDAKRIPRVVLGFKVTARSDAMWEHRQCPLAHRFYGVFLPDEMPDLYPADCLDEDACCCILYETVLSSDETPESRVLRKKIRDRGLPDPPPP